MDIQDFWVKVGHMLLDYEYRTWRTGQTYSNVLHEVHPVLAQRVVEQGIDPFYQDTNIPAFRRFITENW